LPFTAAAAFTTIARGAIRRALPFDIESREFPGAFAGQKFNRPRAAVVDTELWLILAAMIGWTVLGCFLTARRDHHAPRHSSQH
jgi:hypothetical protein